MMRLVLAAGLVATLAACTPPAQSLSAQPERLAAKDFFILRASQNGVAQLLGRSCPAYRYDRAKGVRLKQATIDRVGDADVLPTTPGGREAFRKRAVAEAVRLTTRYVQDNNLGPGVDTAQYCRVAAREHAARSIIGQLLIKR